MVDEVMGILRLEPGKRIWDATVGTGGHSEMILRRILPGGHLYCSDWDIESLEIATERLKKYGRDVDFFKADFKEIGMGTIDFPGNEIDGILIDLGLSSYQLASKDRGLSFSLDGPLDMRMDRHKTITASRIINDYDYQEIKRIFKEYGEEPRASIIARAVVTARQIKPIQTTSELRKLVVDAVGTGKMRSKIHPATLTFQALRIAVNGELEKLFEGLEGLVKLLRKGGRMVVISFHSLEDRIVKTLLRKLSSDCSCPPWFPVCRCSQKAQVIVLTSKPIQPSLAEVSRNVSSRSARLRALEKI
ncbi:MAG: 16S rRNA (cytosine(1402)-N(4))-methyltransferase [Candidatus Schekmanbacteria bacterium RBG_13_48_7]|uniref:Ribosomal RNA small subunit methyltransferase H n=1 Tax=Candidatus Schekmanbacteria bacterium RBG_13_48_7 TaxID=1817878 RepID=A0A1F7RUW3_9BACT|nr:MAG: 16S rRNA (cytosine(1402)-N(4))-methyltransferase [Candidatus Schekmanbacteria bacterium RBG_13_48_7]